jgi:formamidase
MATHEIRIDRRLPLAGEPHTGHNRWHPDIPPALRCDPGDEVLLETRDTFDGYFDAGSTAKDIEGADFNLVHPVTGPVFVTDAEPGDLLVAEILEVIPEPFGFTAQVPGFGFLRDDFPDPFLVRWELADGQAASDDLPGVRIAGAPFMGVIGVAPSRDLLRTISAREEELAGRDGAVVLLPDAAGAIPADPAIAGEALRTIPPREHGGNADIKQHTAGSRLLFPVWVDGALFSAGDAHFAQGDGESCGTAIEMSATLRVRLDLRKGQAAERGIRTLCWERDNPGPAEASPPARYFATTGICVGRDGRNEFEDLTLAARNALDAMLGHITAEYGYSRQQAYAICSVAVDLKISQAVDVPNVIVSAFLPLDIFT